MYEKKGLEKLLREKIEEVISEPTYNWTSDFRGFMTSNEGKPVVRVAVANCSVDMDIWKGLRTPANVGVHPLTPADIWMHYAAMHVKNTRPDGMPNPLAMPESFNDASRRFQRVIIISGMLAVNPQVFRDYAKKIEDGDADPLDHYRLATNDVSAIIDRALSKAALQMMSPDRAVIPMTKKNTDAIISRTRAEYTKGRYHGPCNDHWPKNSIAVMTGLLRFGVNRIPFRDEVTKEGNCQRLFGRYGSIVVFDKERPVKDDGKGITLLDYDNLEWLKKVNDYTIVDPEVTSDRYCTYNLLKPDGASICGKCIEMCPSNALPNSSPLPDGVFPDKILRQKHRFWKETLDFDYANCSRDRTQKAEIFEDYVCARCEAICASRGIQKSSEQIEVING